MVKVASSKERTVQKYFLYSGSEVIIHELLAKT